VRALNLAQSRVYAEHAVRIIPAAAIPMFDPREALEELDYAVGKLGHKVIMIPTALAEGKRDLFAANFYFGCEADDPITACAFDARVVPFGARLRAIFGSDIGHYDVPDMARVVEEACELVERGLLDEESFRGTSVESHAKEILQGAR